MAGMPPATMEVNDAVAQRLVRDQRPDLADHPLVRVTNGWDNATFRLGDDLAVRLPRRAEAVPLILHEQRYVPDIARRSPVAVPVPVHAGRPTSAPQAAGRPLKVWPISCWPFTCPPKPASRCTLSGDAAAGSWRFGMERLVDRKRYPQAAALREAWAQACATEAWDGPAMMLHGDLHPGNIMLADRGSLAGVIDIGDVGAGDPAVDLAVGWLMFDAGTRHRFMGGFGSAVDGDTCMRARGWALILSTAMLSDSDDNPRMFAVGKFGIRQILDARPSLQL